MLTQTLNKLRIIQNINTDGKVTASRDDEVYGAGRREGEEEFYMKLEI